MSRVVLTAIFISVLLGTTAVALGDTAMQVVVHEGGPQFSDVPPELVPAELVRQDGPLLLVRVLRDPKAVAGISEGDTISVLSTPSLEFPIFVTDSYLQERLHSYILAPCAGCGFSELFDCPSDLATANFQGLTPSAFTSRCPLCGDAMVIRLLPDRPSTPRDASPSQVENAIRAVTVSVLRRDSDHLASHDLLSEHGADDLDLINVIFALEDHFVVMLPDDLVGDYELLSIASLVRIVGQALVEHDDGEILR